MEIIEKRVYEEGRDNGCGCGRDRDRSTRERANSGLTLGIIGTALGAAALWGRGRGNGIGAILGGGSDGGTVSPANVNINAYGGMSGGGGCIAPTSFQAFEKGCSDILALTNEMWGLKVSGMQSATQAREVDIAEKFGLYKTMIDADFALYKDNRDNIDSVNNRINNELFSLYKYTRDKDDETRKELCELRSQVAVANAVRPYQDRLLQCAIDNAYTASVNYTDRRTCRMIQGQLVLPNTPVVSGYAGYNCCCNQFPTATAPANPA